MFKITIETDDEQAMRRLLGEVLDVKNRGTTATTSTTVSSNRWEAMFKEKYGKNGDARIRLNTAAKFNLTGGREAWWKQLYEKLESGEVVKNRKGGYELGLSGSGSSNIIHGKTWEGYKPYGEGGAWINDKGERLADLFDEGFDVE